MHSYRSRNIAGLERANATARATIFAAQIAQKLEGEHQYTVLERDLKELMDAVKQVLPFADSMNFFPLLLQILELFLFRLLWGHVRISAASKKTVPRSSVNYKPM